MYILNWGSFRSPHTGKHYNHFGGLGEAKALNVLPGRMGVFLLGEENVW